MKCTKTWHDLTFLDTQLDFLPHIYEAKSKVGLDERGHAIEKFIHCSLQGGPLGGPACPPVYIYEVESRAGYPEM